MRRNAVKTASARLAASLVVLAAVTAPAVAGDRALLGLIGYSDDGRYFVFEEYGVQDGSGFAYSTVYVVDLPADKWVTGSPFRVQAGEENWDAPLGDIRAAAMDAAGDRLEALGIDQPAEILALVGDGVPGNEGRELDFASPGFTGPGTTQDDVQTLSLETFAVTPTEDYCAEMDAVGYALSVSDGDGTRELHRDGATLPRSRGCTLDYRLYAVVQPFGANAHRVAIISSYPFGFEGPDRRFLAVPID